MKLQNLKLFALFVAFSLPFIVKSQCSGNLIPNGSNEGGICGVSNSAPNWTNFNGTADYWSDSSCNTNLIPYVPSPDGGGYGGVTWFNFTQEAWGLPSVSVNPMTDYTLSFYTMVTNLPIPSARPGSERCVEVSIDNGITWQTAYVHQFPAEDKIWVQSTINFTTGTFPTIDIQFRAACGFNDNALWAMVDGVCLLESVPPACSIDDPGVISGTCISPGNDLGFNITITASNTTSTYSVTSGGVSIAAGATYDTPMTFTIPGAADGTNKIITVTDDGDPACTRDVTITGAASCFSCDAGTEGPRFLGLTKSTWIAIGIISGVGASAGVLLKKFVF